MTTTAAIVSDGLGWILAAAGWFAYYRARRAHSAYRESSAGLTLRAVDLALRSANGVVAPCPRCGFDGRPR